MKTVLVYQKEATPLVWDISTSQLRGKAFLALFNLLNDWGCYDDIQSDLAYQLELQKRLYKLANEGNCFAAEQLLTFRRDWGYEYEHWDEVKVQA